MGLAGGWAAFHVAEGRVVRRESAFESWASGLELGELSPSVTTGAGVELAGDQSGGCWRPDRP